MAGIKKAFFAKIFKSSITIITLILVIQSVLSAQDKTEQIRAYLEQVRLTTGAPALSAAVAVDYRIVFSGGVGYADIENKVPATGKTVYRVASISKPIGAIGLMQLLEQGRVALDDPIQNYVPSFPQKQDTITLEHLLTHTSGIRHYNSGEFGAMVHYESLADAIGIFKDDPLRFAPGTDYSYSTYGFNLVQGVIETASEMDILNYMRRFVWEPAGMLSTYFEMPGEIVYNRAQGYTRTEGQIRNARYTDVSIKYIGGGIISTVEDLVRVFIALDNGVLMKPESVELMYTEHYNLRPNSGRALGWSVDTDSSGRRRISHSGGATGFGSMLINYPDQKVIVAVISNQDFSSVGRVAQNIAQAYLIPH
ncbi:serine hydrolase domain-containing protein [candidate division KSB1 bacterium]